MWGHESILVAHAFRNASVDCIVHDRFRYGRCKRLGLRNIYELPFASACAVCERCHYCERRVLGGGVVGVGYLRQDGRPAVVSTDVGQAGSCFGRVADCAIVCPGPGIAVSCGRDHDNVRSDLTQVFVLQIEVSHDARREVFGEDIADANQFAQGVNAILVVEFERETIFVAILLVEVCRAVPVVSIASVLVERACTVVV